MSMVLIVHADFYSLGGVDINEFSKAPLSAWTRTILEFSSLICVNLFILISGWFHINATLKGLCNFLFQCLFFLTIIFTISILTGLIEFSIHGLCENFLKSPMNWFIISYSILYILSPIINSYLSTSPSKKSLLITIILTSVDVILGWTGIAPCYLKGYSPLTFINLYLIGHALKSYRTDKYKWGGGLFFIIVIINSILYYLNVHGTITLPNLTSYDSPIIIIQTICFFSWFSTLNVKQNLALNYIASSAFAVYLLHTNIGFIGPVFKALNNYIYTSYYGITCLVLISIFCLVVFVVAVLLDQPRKWLWNLLSPKITNYRL